MFKVTNIGRALMIAALAAGPALAAVGAHAEDLRIRVGDVSQPDGARAFNDRLATATRSLCAGYSLADLANREACAASVRRQALAQLSADQRAELETPNHGMAMAAPANHSASH